MLFILLFIPSDYAGSCFIGFAIGESLGASALRILAASHENADNRGGSHENCLGIKEDVP